MIRNCIMAIAMGLTLATQAFANWPLWDQFKAVNYAEGRVIDYSDSRSVTTSEGQSYSLFFALAAGDQDTFASLLSWTENNLAGGDLGKNSPAWLWGSEKPNGAGPWKILDPNNASDSDMWIAYTLLEAGRLWNKPEYKEKGLAMLEVLKSQVRELPGVGKVLLPGLKGFESASTLTLNPSYYPIFLLRRFALEDPYWVPVAEGSLRLILKSSPNGYAPDWITFRRDGTIAAPKTADESLGTYNAIRVYLWAAIMSPEDPAYGLLRHHFEPMVIATKRMNLPPEKVDIYTTQFTHNGPEWFASCLLPYLEGTKEAAFLRAMLMNAPLKKESYYGNVLTLFGLGYDQARYGFDEDGRLILPTEKAAAPAGQAK